MKEKKINLQATRQHLLSYHPFDCANK